jgi:hypothetical protein
MKSYKDEKIQEFVVESRITKLLFFFLKKKNSISNITNEINNKEFKFLKNIERDFGLR